MRTAWERPASMIQLPPTRSLPSHVGIVGATIQDEIWVGTQPNHITYTTKLYPNHLGHMSSELPEAVSWVHPYPWQIHFLNRLRPVSDTFGLPVIALLEKRVLNQIPRESSWISCRKEFKASTEYGERSKFIRNYFVTG
uniref:Uncharacterized protein n=1 Tax=Macaca fascicularis TaxID=9541 RepID=A0A7N9DAC2_MACFA